MLIYIAIEFLMRNGFDMGAPFFKGAPYLSRAEEATALAIEAAKSDKAKIEDIHLRPDEVDSINFVRRVRNEIEQWKNRGPVGKPIHYNQNFAWLTCIPRRIQIMSISRLRAIQ
jgi:poly(A)-specific ribonuclease